MNIDLNKLYSMQRSLDDSILKRFPKLKNECLLSKKTLALQVEIGELLQEFREFKFWSEDQEPRDGIVCDDCFGSGKFTKSYRAMGDDVILEHIELTYFCGKCKGTGEQSSPLLEEYVDGIHFFLSLGLEINMSQVLPNITKKKTILEQFTSVYVLISQFAIGVEIGDEEEYLQDDLSSAFGAFIGLGEMLGFTGEQVEHAYFAKNAVNHERQVNGY